MARTNPRTVAATSGRALARRTTGGVAVAILALLVTQALVDAAGADLGGAGPMTPFAAGPLVGTTIVAGVGAAVVYAAMVKLTARPGRNFVAVAAVVFGLMLGPVLLVTPSMGITSVGQAVLVLYHLLVAVPLVAFIVGVVSL